MALSASVVKVFVIGKGLFVSRIPIAGVEDAGDFVAAIQSKFTLSDIEALHLELRVVSTEPNVKNAQRLFDDAPEEAAIVDSASLPKSGEWVVGKIVALPNAAGAAASANGATNALAGSGTGAESVAGERWLENWASLLPVQSKRPNVTLGRAESLVKAPSGTVTRSNPSVLFVSSMQTLSSACLMGICYRCSEPSSTRLSLLARG